MTERLSARSSHEIFAFRRKIRDLEHRKFHDLRRECQELYFKALSKSVRTNSENDIFEFKMACEYNDDIRNEAFERNRKRNEINGR